MVCNSIKIIDTTTGKELKVIDCANIDLNPIDVDYEKPFGNPSSLEFGLNIDMSARRMIDGLVCPVLSNNNWRKLHGLPMWRK